MSGDHLNLDAIEAQTRHRAQWGDDAHCGTVLALVAEVRRLREVEASVKALVAAAGDGFVTFGGGRSGGLVSATDLRGIVGRESE